MSPTMKEALSSALAAGGTPSDSEPPRVEDAPPPPASEAPRPNDTPPSGGGLPPASGEPPRPTPAHHPADPRVVITPMRGTAEQRAHYAEVLERHRIKAAARKGRGPRARKRKREQ